MEREVTPILAGRKALVVGVANDQSIAYGCAKAITDEREFFESQARPGHPGASFTPHHLDELVLRL